MKGAQLSFVHFGLLVIAIVLILKLTWWLLLLPIAVYGLMQTNFAQRAQKTVRRDIKGLYLLLRMKLLIKQRLVANQPIHEIWLERVKEHPLKEAAVEVETGRIMTYRELNQLTNKYANYFSEQGYKNGDVVALFMENNIDFIALWLGLSKIGVVSAFINTNLKMEPLGYSINVSRCKSVITTATLLPILDKAKAEGLIPSDLKTFINSGEAATAENLETTIREVSSDEPPKCPHVNFQSILCLIFTSGTTGNPKPAVIKHFRFYWMSMGAVQAFDIRHDDRVYITMPIYHSAAGILGVGSIITLGTTIVLRKKFSASNFWKDAIAHGCTSSQYIGELCRYLLAQKPTPEEKQHKIRMMYGNGLRGAIWREFTSRFGIEKIGELYGSTEGNSSFVNIDNHVGSCGFLPIYPVNLSLYPVNIVKVDEESGQLIRDKNGLAVPCKPGETGEVVGMIKNKEVLLRFEGYVDEADTKKKIYTDILQKGDKAFASGDILHWDELGYLYFKDRRGDTFRWKGENVSTTQVEGLLQPLKSIVDCTVYGVEIGKHEGRAGMAALHLTEGSDVQELLTEATERFTANLASYAIPVFIRICNGVEKTATYKLRKTDLQKSGFDLSKVDNDPIFFFNSADQRYVPLTADLQRQIISGEYARI